MKRTTLAISTLVLAAGLTPPAAGQANDQVTHASPATRKACTSHKAMRNALFVDYVDVIGGGGYSARASQLSHVVRRPANDPQAIRGLGKVHDRMMRALRGGNRTASCCLDEASIANLNSLCGLHRMLHETFAGGKPGDIAALRSQIETAGLNCPHGV